MRSTKLLKKHQNFKKSLLNKSLRRNNLKSLRKNNLKSLRRNNLKSLRKNNLKSFRGGAEAAEKDKENGEKILTSIYNHGDNDYGIYRNIRAYNELLKKNTTTSGSGNAGGSRHAFIASGEMAKNRPSEVEEFDVVLDELKKRLKSASPGYNHTYFNVDGSEYAEYVKAKSTESSYDPEQLYSVIHQEEESFISLKTISELEPKLPHPVFEGMDKTGNEYINIQLLPQKSAGVDTPPPPPPADYPVEFISCFLDIANPLALIDGLGEDPQADEGTTAEGGTAAAEGGTAADEEIEKYNNHGEVYVDTYSLAPTMTKYYEISNPVDAGATGYDLPPTDIVYQTPTRSHRAYSFIMEKAFKIETRWKELKLKNLVGNTIRRRYDIDLPATILVYTALQTFIKGTDLTKLIRINPYFIDKYMAVVKAAPPSQGLSDLKNITEEYVKRLSASTLLTKVEATDPTDGAAAATAAATTTAAPVQCGIWSYPSTAINMDQKAYYYFYSKNFKAPNYHGPGATKQSAKNILFKIKVKISTKRPYFFGRRTGETNEAKGRFKVEGTYYYIHYLEIEPLLKKGTSGGPAE